MNRAEDQRSKGLSNTDRGSAQPPDPIVNSLRGIFVLVALLAGGRLAAQDFRSEMIATQLVENGIPIQLELVVAKPPGTGPFPTVVFNHGSTGSGSDPAEFTKTWTSVNAARFFNERGWMVVYPQRRGRGRSGGLYDEGFAPDRSGYTCTASISLAGLERAMVDVDEVVRHLRTRTDVDSQRMLVGGFSRGGILAVAYAGTRPGVFLGAVNFVGGWIGDQCPTVAAINPVTFIRGAAYPEPTLWLYGENDSFYRMSHSRSNFASFIGAGGHGEFFAYSVPAGQNGHFLLGYPELWEGTLANYLQTLPRLPAMIQATGGRQAVALGGQVTLSVTGGANPLGYQWTRNGSAIEGATGSTLLVNGLLPGGAGLYQAAIARAGGTRAEADPMIVGPVLAEKISGSGREVGADIVHPNGRVYDQFLLEGPAVSLTADAGQIARLSFIDLSDDIVQVEFSGAGTLTLTLESASGPAQPRNYEQPSVSYYRGHASIVIVGADETSNVSVFSVGRANAVNQGLFRADVTYDGVADIASLAIVSPTGRFGGLRTANVSYFGSRGVTGIYAPGIDFAGPVYVGNISAHDTATPVLWVGAAADVRVAGGDLRQDNGRAVQVGGFSRLQFVEGRTSHDGALPARANRARLERRGEDVTGEVVVGP